MRLFEYCLYASAWYLHGQLSKSDLQNVEIHVYADGDLCGNFWDTKSTSGIWVELAAGGHTWPISWASKSQPATAAHTQESETVALSTAIRTEAMPVQLFLSEVLCRPVRVRLMEDNTSTVEACLKGYSPSLRHLPRHQRCALGTVHDVCFDDKDSTEDEIASRRDVERKYGVISLQHHDGDTHKADLFTKELPRVPFENKLKLIGMNRV